MRTNLPLSTAFVLSAALVFCDPADARQGRGAVPQGASGTVTLTVADYDRLVDRATQPVVRPDPPPIPAVVGRAEIRARIDGLTARGTMRLDGEVFQRGAVKVALVSGATLLDAKTDGRPLPLLQEGNTHSAVFSGPAPFSAALEWATPLNAVPGRASFTLPQAASGSVNIVVDLPGDPADIRVEPGLVTRRETAAGRTAIEITPAPGGPTQVSWSVRESATQAPAESRTLADVKSLVTIGDGDLRMVSLIDITVVRGEPATFQVQLPKGYEVAAITGTTLEGSDQKGGVVTLTVREPARRRHQFLLTLDQPHAAGSFKVETSFPMVVGAQREAGEAAIEGTGTMDVNAAGDEGLRRMDVREANAALRSLARQPILSAFRYQRRPNESRVLTLDVKRFADAPVIAAAAEHAVATTLVTTEGRTLTEVMLRISNRAQPFMKVTLPPGATMLSVEVAGEPARPVEGGGIRIPLLRSGFRPSGPYSVSFVYLHAGQAFARRGDAAMALASVDVPISLLEWEVFLPEQYSAKPIAGNVIPAKIVHSAAASAPVSGLMGSQMAPRVSSSTISFMDNGRPGEITGRVVDHTGASIPGATVTLSVDGGSRQRTVSDANGMYTFRRVPSGTVTVTSELAGFVPGQSTFSFDQQPRRLDFQMQVQAITETVTVSADSVRDLKAEEMVQQAPSQNIINMQRRVAGVLPVRIDVPRAGTAYRFFRPLVLGEESNVSFRYRRR